MGCTIDDWKATLVGERLRIVGNGTCTQGGCKLRLDLGDIGIVPDPEAIALQLDVRCPEIGTDVITPAHVAWENRVEPTVKRVRIDTDAGSVWVDVTRESVPAPARPTQAP